MALIQMSFRIASTQIFFESTDPAVSDNKLLAAQREQMSKSRVGNWPTAIINGMKYKGDLHPVDYVFDTVCEAFNTKPDPCLPESSNSSSVVIIVVVAISVVLMLFIAFIFYRRSLRRELRKEMALNVNQMVAQYFATGDGKGKIYLREQLITQDEKKENVDARV